MKKPELARRLAELGETTPGEAADRLDDIIYVVLKKLRQGKAAAFPGLGRIAEPKQPAKRKQAK